MSNLLGLYKNIFTYIRKHQDCHEQQGKRKSVHKGGNATRKLKKKKKINVIVTN